MAEPTAIELWRTERALRWRRAEQAYAEASVAYERAVAIYQTRLNAPRPRLSLVRTQPAPAPIPVTPPEGPRRGTRKQFSRLTGRQREIARLVADGMTNKQIARQLVLTEGTVANHVRAILLRLGLRSRAQVAVWYVSGGG
jgi:DNA-binding NarL/FixJ family response regulator